MEAPEKDIDYCALIFLDIIETGNWIRLIQIGTELDVIFIIFLIQKAVTILTTAIFFKFLLFPQRKVGTFYQHQQ